MTTPRVRKLPRSTPWRQSRRRSPLGPDGVPGPRRGGQETRRGVRAGGSQMIRYRATALLVVSLLSFAGGCDDLQKGTVITFPASAVGKEGQVLDRQIERFHQEHP